MTDEGKPPPRRVVSDTAERERRLRWERETRTQIADLASRVEELGDAPLPDNLAEVVAQLREDVDKLQEAAAKVPPPAHWDDITDPGERARREHDLQRWVDEVLAVWHPRQAAGVLSCWYEHLSSRQIVTAGWQAWVGALRAKGRKHSDHAYWIRVTLPAMVAEVQGEIGDPMVGCDAHPSAPPLTDPAPED